MSARLLPLGGWGLCPVRTIGGGGEREWYVCPDCCTMELIAFGLVRYPTGGVGVGTGGGPTMGVGLVPDEVARPPCRIDCLLFWNLQRPMGSEITTRMSTKELNRPNLHTPCRHIQLFR